MITVDQFMDIKTRLANKQSLNYLVKPWTMRAASNPFTNQSQYALQTYRRTSNSLLLHADGTVFLFYLVALIYVSMQAGKFACIRL